MQTEASVNVIQSYLGPREKTDTMKWKNRVQTSLLVKEDGVTSIEYAIIGSLIALVIIITVTTLGTNIKALYQNVSDSFP